MARRLLLLWLDMLSKTGLAVVEDVGVATMGGEFDDKCLQEMVSNFRLLYVYGDLGCGQLACHPF